ncbi:hypothetical protein ECH_1141 [Ehrlichia chaffeensis str. Arkansas]|uniref:Uncharacterized protein n=1 Tax=Ehrlichia chaffeensis (strain ATCC CRL-10679 / Arkansas) TaxID=205920 RepID=Q2GF58_EHRCR|nr:hypothetical protein ECH_1141 [Ehrlichia chaffeensis str. Arkansas]
MFVFPEAVVFVKLFSVSGIIRDMVNSNLVPPPPSYCYILLPLFLFTVAIMKTSLDYF